MKATHELRIKVPESWKTFLQRKAESLEMTESELVRTVIQLHYPDGCKGEVKNGRPRKDQQETDTNES